MSNPRGRILCIDDEPNTLKTRQMVLEMAGFSVRTASSGAEGLLILAKDAAIDLVLLDYLMPEMNGEQAAREIRRLYPGLPIVLITAFSEIPGTLLDIVDAYVRKGQDPQLLLVTVNNTIAARR